MRPVAEFMRLALDDGGFLLVRVGDDPPEAADEGPVRAGRLGDAVDQVTRTVHETLQPVRQMSRELLAELRGTGPGAVEVEFGIELTAQAGAVLAKTQAGCHLVVRLSWDADPGPVP